MLQAMTEKGEFITLPLLPEQTIQKFKESRTLFFCPVCKSQVIIKAGSKMIAHFAHKSLLDCPNQSGGEGAYHEQGKLLLYSWLKQQGYDVDLESYLPMIKQRADLMINRADQRIALEYQCATISIKEILSRTKGYQSIGITPIWILGGNRMRRLGKQGLFLTKTEQSFLHQFKRDQFPKQLYYCPDKNQFARYDFICSSGQTRTVGQLQFHQLNETTFMHLLQPLKIKSFSNQWLQEKKRFRLYVPKRLFGQERKFREWLYLNQCPTSLLSSWVGLPVPGQWQMRVSIWTWQAYLCYDFFNKKPYFTLREMQSFVKPFRKTNHSNFPMLSPDQDPVLSYLNYFVKSGKIDCHRDHYQLNGTINLYQSFDQASKNDLRIHNFLGNRLHQTTSKGKTRV